MQNTRAHDIANHPAGPGNLETIVRELMEYFQKPPSPLGSDPMPYNEKTIYTLLERLRPYDLTKAEIIMIMDTRPTHPAILQNLIQEFDERFAERGADETRQEILDIVAEVLGTPDAGEADKMAAAREEAGAQRQRDRDAPAEVEDMEQ